MASRSLALARPLGAALLFGAVLALAVLLGSCSKSDTTTTTTSNTNATPTYGPAVSMGFPTSLTGAVSSAASVRGIARLLSTTQVSRPLADEVAHCDYDGQHESDFTANGHRMARFLVGTVASWLCFTDFIDRQVTLIVEAVPTIVNLATNGGIVDFCTDKPCTTGDVTGLRITEAQSGQFTVELFWDSPATTPGMYLSWLTTGSDTVGKLVVLSYAITPNPSLAGGDAAAPTHMRLDFTISVAQRTAQMYMAFSPDGVGTVPNYDNPWADGFRIDAVKDRSTRNFQVGGIISVRHHIFPDFESKYPAPTYPLPTLQMKAVTITGGAGAAQATMSDIGVLLNFPAPSYLGDFQFTKDDLYYFGGDSSANYVNKTVSAATYLGNKSTTTPYDDAFINGALGLSSNQFTSCTSSPGTPDVSDQNCVDFLNALFGSGGGFFTDVNSSASEPTDARHDNLLLVSPPASAWPDGSTDWSNVFDTSFTPPAP